MNLSSFSLKSIFGFRLLCFRVLKFFAVCYGLRLVPVETYAMRFYTSTRRKSLQTSAKKFLMHAPAQKPETLYVNFKTRS